MFTQTSKFHTTKAKFEISVQVCDGLTRMITLENVGGISAATLMKTLPISEKNNSFYSQNQFPTSETTGRMDTSFWRSNFWRSNFGVFLVDKR